MTLLKSIVVCLALANVGYFLWARGIERSQAVPINSPPVESLKLVSEAPEDVSSAPTVDAPETALEASSPTPAGEPPTPAPAGDAGRCLSIGPFKDVSDASRAASTLISRGYDTRQRVVEGDVWAGVWVYLPVPPSRAANEQVMAKLKSAGIDDAMEMPGPSEGSVISLGLFSEQKRAQARVALAQSLGLTPGVADRKRTGNVYWIDLDLKPTDTVPTPQELQGEAGRISRLDVQDCPSPTAGTP